MTISLNHVLHVNLNCTDQYISRDMLGLLGFSPASVLKADPQDGADMGVDGLVQWDGFAMISEAAWQSPMIDLLSFNLPPVTGKAYATLNNIGYNRLIIRVASLQDAHAALTASPHITFASDWHDDSHEGLFSARDADGIWYDIIPQQDELAAGLGGVVVSCADLDSSRQWYTEQLGLQLVDGPKDLRLAAQQYAPGLENAAEALMVRSCDLSIAGRPDFVVRLQQAERPVDKPYKLVNHVGLYRMAFAVDDIQASYQQLLAAGVNCPKPPVYQDMGDDVPVDGVWALFFYDPDGICVELIQPPDL